MTQSRIQRWVRENAGTWLPGSRLATDRQLAAQFGVSIMTVRRALTRCARDGLLVRVRGKGTFVPPLSEPASVTSHSRLSWERLADRLEAACREGELKRGDDLPFHKEMQRLFRVGPSTVTRACRELERRGWLTRTGKRYVIGGADRLPRYPSRSEILLLAESEDEAARLFTNDYMALTLQKMESELLSCGYSLRFDVYDRNGSLPAAWNQRSSSLQGIILTGTDSGRVTESDFERILTGLRIPRRGGPRVLILTTNVRPRIAGMRSFSTSHTTTVMCRELARFIAAKAWQHVEVIYDASASGNGHLMDVFRLLPELERFCPRARLRYRIVGYADPARHGRFSHVVMSLLAGQPLVSRLSKYRAVTPAEIRGFVTMHTSLEETVEEIGPGSVAVCHAATTAVALQRICARHAPAVPGRLSIVSLENAPACLHREITACIRDWESNGYLMAHALMGDFPVALTNRGFIVARARIMQRSSTGG